MGYFRRLLHVLCRRLGWKSHQNKANRKEHSSKPFPLFNLPLELRQKIYYHALTITKPPLPPEFNASIPEFHARSRLVSTSQFASLTRAIPEFAHPRIRGQVVRPNDLLYIDSQISFHAANTIRKKCRHQEMAYSLRMSWPVSTLIICREGPGFHAHRKYFEIWCR